MHTRHVPQATVTSGDDSVTQTAADAASAVPPTAPHPQPPVRRTEDTAADTRTQDGTVFSSADIAAIHEQQTALEVDRREQERLARLAELANRD